MPKRLHTTRNAIATYEVGLAVAVAATAYTQVTRLCFQTFEVDGCHNHTVLCVCRDAISHGKRFFSFAAGGLGTEIRISIKRRFPDAAAYRSWWMGAGPKEKGKEKAKAKIKLKGRRASHIRDCRIGPAVTVYEEKSVACSCTVVVTTPGRGSIP